MLFFGDIAIIIVALMLVLIVATQVVFPMLKGSPLFPFFRKSTVRELTAKTAKDLGIDLSVRAGAVKK
jgi:hypothetical protein